MDIRQRSANGYERDDVVGNTPSNPVRVGRDNSMAGTDRFLQLDRVATKDRAKEMHFDRRTVT